ncbi:hypothetical protein BESB_081590 [Besnoitia besnoiti]|uniref:Uncharacterized protein n=1 Tax=Besnoitia besnoiti TaxID=94643 RepID=A0A2A9MC38_BESBE|nr:hypothetical protein BESB_081590 [Besnoitia besnoiti]PFH32960.1 hypothetical protein BESB_081590 [Besnoitia besnoiti]
MPAAGNPPSLLSSGSCTQSLCSEDPSLCSESFPPSGLPPSTSPRLSLRPASDFRAGASPRREASQAHGGVERIKPENRKARVSEGLDDAADAQAGKAEMTPTQCDLNQLLVRLLSLPSSHPRAPGAVPPSTAVAETVSTGTGLEELPGRGREEDCLRETSPAREAKGRSLNSEAVPERPASDAVCASPHVGASGNDEACERLRGPEERSGEGVNVASGLCESGPKHAGCVRPRPEPEVLKGDCDRSACADAVSNAQAAEERISNEGKTVLKHVVSFGFSLAALEAWVPQPSPCCAAAAAVGAWNAVRGLSVPRQPMGEKKGSPTETGALAAPAEGPTEAPAGAERSAADARRLGDGAPREALTSDAALLEAEDLGAGGQPDQRRGEDQGRGNALSPPPPRTGEATKERRSDLLESRSHSPSALDVGAGLEALLVQARIARKETRARFLSLLLSPAQACDESLRTRYLAELLEFEDYVLRELLKAEAAEKETRKQKAPEAGQATPRGKAATERGREVLSSDAAQDTEKETIVHRPATALSGTGDPERAACVEQRQAQANGCSGETGGLAEEKEPQKESNDAGREEEGASGDRRESGSLMREGQTERTGEQGQQTPGAQTSEMKAGAEEKASGLETDKKRGPSAAASPARGAKQKRTRSLLLRILRETLEPFLLSGGHERPPASLSPFLAAVASESNSFSPPSGDSALHAFAQTAASPSSPASAASGGLHATRKPAVDSPPSPPFSPIALRPRSPFASPSAACALDSGVPPLALPRAPDFPTLSVYSPAALGDQREESCRAGAAVSGVGASAASCSNACEEAAGGAGERALVRLPAREGGEGACGTSEARCCHAVDCRSPAATSAHAASPVSPSEADKVPFAAAAPPGVLWRLARSLWSDSAACEGDAAAGEGDPRGRLRPREPSAVCGCAEEGVEAREGEDERGSRRAQLDGVSCSSSCTCGSTPSSPSHCCCCSVYSASPVPSRSMSPSQIHPASSPGSPRSLSPCCFPPSPRWFPPAPAASSVRPFSRFFSSALSPASVATSSSLLVVVLEPPKNPDRVFALGRRRSGRAATQAPATSKLQLANPPRASPLRLRGGAQESEKRKRKETRHCLEAPRLKQADEGSPAAGKQLEPPAEEPGRDDGRASGEEANAGSDAERENVRCGVSEERIGAVSPLEQRGDGDRDEEEDTSEADERARRDRRARGAARKSDEEETLGQITQEAEGFRLAVARPLEEEESRQAVKRRGSDAARLRARKLASALEVLMQRGQAEKRLLVAKPSTRHAGNKQLLEAFVEIEKTYHSCLPRDDEGKDQAAPEGGSERECRHANPQRASAGDTETECGEKKEKEETREETKEAESGGGEAQGWGDEGRIGGRDLGSLSEKEESRAVAEDSGVGRTEEAGASCDGRPTEDCLGASWVCPFCRNGVRAFALMGGAGTRSRWTVGGREERGGEARVGKQAKRKRGGGKETAAAAETDVDPAIEKASDEETEGDDRAEALQAEEEEVDGAGEKRATKKKRKRNSVAERRGSNTAAKRGPAEADAEREKARAEEEEEAERDWRRFLSSFEERDSAIVVHLQNHYALVFGWREILVEGADSENSERPKEPGEISGALRAGAEAGGWLPCPDERAEEGNGENGSTLAPAELEADSLRVESEEAASATVDKRISSAAKEAQQQRPSPLAASQGASQEQGKAHSPAHACKEGRKCSESVEAAERVSTAQRTASLSSAGERAGASECFLVTSETQAPSFFDACREREGTPSCSPTANASDAVADGSWLCVVEPSARGGLVGGSCGVKKRIQTSGEQTECAVSCAGDFQQPQSPSLLCLGRSGLPSNRSRSESREGVYRREDKTPEPRRRRREVLTARRGQAPSAWVPFDELRVLMTRWKGYRLMQMQLLSLPAVTR